VRRIDPGGFTAGNAKVIAAQSAGQPVIERAYEKGIKITDAEMEALDIRGDTFDPEWSYTAHPRPKKL